MLKQRRRRTDVVRRANYYVWLLLASFLSPNPLSSSLAASGSSECLRLYERALRTGREVRSFDLVKMRAWVEAQPPEIRPFAEMLTRRYEIISIAAFTEHLVTATSQLLAEVPKEKLVFVHLNFEGFYKSGAWVTGIIFEKFPGLREVPAADLPEADFRVTRCPDPPCVYVYVDDAAYSGDQARRALTLMAAKLKKEVGSAARIVALIPAVTTRARELLETIDTPSLRGLRSDFWPQTKIKVFYNYRMKDVKEIAAEEHVEIPPFFIEQADRTLTYMGHKVADGQSTLSFFSDARILIRNGQDYKQNLASGLRFIPSIDPPYFQKIEPQ